MKKTEKTEVKAEETATYGTRFPEFWGAIARTFPPDQVKTRPQGGMNLEFITARTVQNRLDEVAGPENWWCRFEYRNDSVLCELSIRAPDGTVVTKQDAGGYSATKDDGDNDKGGISDAFKRAAVMFGIGRHLYHDPSGIPSYAAKADEKAAEDRYREISVIASNDLKNRVSARNAKWKEYCVGKGIEVPEDILEPYSASDLERHICRRGVDEKQIPRYNEDDLIRTVIDLSAKDDWFEKKIEEYFKKVWTEKLNKYAK